MLGRTAHQSDSIMLRSLFFFFAVSSGSKVNSLTVKRGSKPPSSKDPDPNNPTVVRGWRVDGYLGLGRTPIKAEKALGVEVAPNNDLWEANDLKKYYGRLFVMKTLKSKDPIPAPFFALIMWPTVFLGNLLGVPTTFTFNKGNYLEKNILGPDGIPYALGGFPSKRQVISFAPANGFRTQYGTLTLEKGCTYDHIVATGRTEGWLLGRGNYECTLDAA